MQTQPMMMMLKLRIVEFVVCMNMNVADYGVPVVRRRERPCSRQRFSRLGSSIFFRSFLGGASLFLT